ncbi:MAG: hypothetical protein NC111_04405 [Bacteroides sp.]|nr:hypothetical protein [Bacteroides sp.]MCM1471752.1 hypothetical protein [Bacteroides sp.]
MRPAEQHLNELLQSPAVALILTVVGCLFFVSAASFVAPAAVIPSGAVAGLSEFVFGSTLSSMIVAAIALLFSIGIISLTNRTFDILRTSSPIYIGLFVMLATAIPGALGTAGYGLLMLPTLLLCLMIMYTTYNRPGATRRVFLVFTLLSAGSPLSFAFAAFIPPMMIGCAQMRCFNLRSLIAALLGVITPFWILLGFGIVSLESLRLPLPSLLSVSTFALYSTPQLIAIFGTVVMAVAPMLYNLVRVFGLNARTRAFNGILALLTLWTAVMTIVDFGHAMTYLPLLAAFTAMQTTLYAQIDSHRRPYLVILAVILLALVVYFYNVVI